MKASVTRYIDELKFKLNYNNNFVGYRVTLWKDGKCKDYLVHRLVAATFLENLLNSKITVNHKDGNRTNNNINNLEWVTRKDNIVDGFINDLYPQKSVTIINLDNNGAATFRSLAQASKFLGKNAGYISLLLKRNKRKFTINDTKYEILEGE